MTIFEASSHLYQWYSQNDSFCLEKDFIKIIKITEHPERDRAAILSALQDYEKSEMVYKSNVEEVDYWVLKRSFLMYPQNITISPDTALITSTVINKFCEITNTRKDYCDPANVTEEDYKNLVSICSFLITDSEDSNKEIDLNGETG